MLLQGPLRLDLLLGCGLWGAALAGLGWAVARHRSQRQLGHLHAELAAGRQQQALFVQRLNHELRTPLTDVVGTAGMLANLPLNDEARRLAALLEQSSSHLVELLDGLTAGAQKAPGRPPQATLPARAPRQAATPAPQPGAPKKVLVVEDNTVNQLVVLGYLRHLDIAATAVANGREALDLLRKQRFDLVLMDCAMPVMDGYEATRHIRADESQQEGRHLPIVAVTANATLEDEAKCRREGMDDYVSKPLKRDTLQRVLQRWLPRPQPAAVGSVAAKERP